MPDSSTFRRLGDGSFATVYVANEGPIAFKAVHTVSESIQLEEEYTKLVLVYTAFSNDAFFKLPRPFAVYNPQTGTLRAEAPKVLTSASFSAHEPLTRTPSYAMDRVPPIPAHVADPIRVFYPAHAKARGTPPPTLCRLYFGKTLRKKPEADLGSETVPETETETQPGARTAPRFSFFSSSNFILDPERYRALAAVCPESLPPIEDVTAGMGVMLARLHWRAGVDARDVEFVLGGGFDASRGPGPGTGTGNGTAEFYVIDFNQMRYWDKSAEQLPVLVSSFRINDPYYPRPNPGEHLYEIFKAAYIAECAAAGNENEMQLAGQFFSLLEAGPGVVA
ncbi:hypothetical protein H0H81_010782 [Sphagnurus paluster]|uniref:DUF3669 domain-containing protein n=1 Tax=Sphagnurus paluster TaxID=117069 RepID=A0A9P7G2B7_9AGAR|nr:hypothetical protein H0H81_010782 [Sphagnurus paluster]